MRPTIYEKVRDCSRVGMHAWYNSSVGVIRKPNGLVRNIDIDPIIEASTFKPSIFTRIWYWVKRILHILVCKV